ncbi:MAG: aminotransferase class [Gemmatimonadetes bacterium]|nr:aminotransferase class [Gemmatimonadota bacterium]
MNAGDTIYMNAASTGPSPQCSVDAQIDFVRRRAMPQTVGFDDQFGILDKCRTLISGMTNADVSEIALAINTGAGINLAAWGLPLGVGDEVVVSDGEFPANMYPWLAAAQSRGFTVHVVPLRNGVLDEDALVAALHRPGVRALSVSWAGFASGIVADLDRLSAECRKRDVFLVVDAIQALPALPLDLARTRIDVLACGGQKWLLSPWGTGFTYVRRDIFRMLTPQPVSWMGVRDSDDFRRLVDYDLTWRDNARRYEQVTLAYQDFAGMAASLELLRDLGIANVATHIHQSAQQLLQGAREKDIETVSRIERHAGIASVRPADAAVTGARLERAGIIHSVREGTIRLAPHCYTTADDIARTLDAL